MLSQACNNHKLESGVPARVHIVAHVSLIIISLSTLRPTYLDVVQHWSWSFQLHRSPLCCVIDKSVSSMRVGGDLPPGGMLPPQLADMPLPRHSHARWHLASFDPQHKDHTTSSATWPALSSSSSLSSPPHTRYQQWGVGLDRVDNIHKHKFKGWFPHLYV